MPLAAEVKLLRAIYPTYASDTNLEYYVETGLDNIENSYLNGSTLNSDVFKLKDSIGVEATIVIGVRDKNDNSVIYNKITLSVQSGSIEALYVTASGIETTEQGEKYVYRNQEYTLGYSVMPNISISLFPREFAIISGQNIAVINSNKLKILPNAPVGSEIAVVFSVTKNNIKLTGEPIIFMVNEHIAESIDLKVDGQNEVSLEYGQTKNLDVAIMPLNTDDKSFAYNILSGEEYIMFDGNSITFKYNTPTDADIRIEALKDTYTDGEQSVLHSELLIIRVATSQINEADFAVWTDTDFVNVGQKYFVYYTFSASTLNQNSPAYIISQEFILDENSKAFASLPAYNPSIDYTKINYTQLTINSDITQSKINIKIKCKIITDKGTYETPYKILRIMIPVTDADIRLDSNRNDSLSGSYTAEADAAIAFYVNVSPVYAYYDIGNIVLTNAMGNDTGKNAGTIVIYGNVITVQFCNDIDYVDKYYELHVVIDYQVGSGQTVTYEVITVSLSIFLSRVEVEGVSINNLTENPNVLFTAISDADKIAKFVMSKEKQEEKRVEYYAVVPDVNIYDETVYKVYMSAENGQTALAINYGFADKEALDKEFQKMQCLPFWKNSEFKEVSFEELQQISVNKAKENDKEDEVTEEKSKIFFPPSVIAANSVIKNAAVNMTDKGIESLTKMSDREVVEKASKTKNGDKFLQLYNGISVLDSESKDERSLMARLAMFCNGDKEQLMRVFKSSGQHRTEKPNGYYLAMAEQSMDFISQVKTAKTPSIPYLGHQKEERAGANAKA